MKQPKVDTQTLLERRRQLQEAICDLGEFRPGQLVGRFRRCGKPNCHCANADDPGHGPSWSLTRVLDGKTRTRVIPVGPSVEATRAQLDMYRHFRALTRELVEVNDALCDARLAVPADQSEMDKKKGSKKRSTKPSSTKPTS